jgi:hypothetical protein
MMNRATHARKFKPSHRDVAIAYADERAKIAAADGSRQLLEALDRYWINHPSDDACGNWAGTQPRAAQVAHASSEVVG